MSGLLDPRARALAITAVSLLAAVSLWFIAGHVIPFDPFTLKGYAALPPADCPSAPLKLDVRYDLVEPRFGHAEGYRLRTNWIEDATGSDTEIAPYTGTFDDFTHGYDQVIESPHYRAARAGRVAGLFGDGRHRLGARLVPRAGHPRQGLRRHLHRSSLRPRKVLYVTDIPSALNFGFGLGWAALIVLLVIHLKRGLHFGPYEWTAVKLLVAIAVPSALERVTLSVLTTPSRLLFINDLPVWVYVIPIACRFLGALAVWVAVGWTLVFFWPNRMRDS